MASQMQTSPAVEGLDAALFVDGPARDDRFDVKDRWVECVNLPGDHPLHEAQFVHRQMNEEVNGIECSARCISDFPETDWGLRMWLARQCSDEARHARMFRRLLEGLGGHVGQFPVLNFQYRIINRAETIVGRLTIQNRTFEAGGIDAVSAVVQQMNDRGDIDLEKFFDSQLADEIVHVRFANEWIRAAIKKDPRTVLHMGAAMTNAAKAFDQVMGRSATEGVSYPTDRDARLEAGFTPDEVEMAANLNAAANAATAANATAAGQG